MTHPDTTALAQIARQHLGLETLETRNSDALDFREVSVWAVKAALEAAYTLGRGTLRCRPRTNQRLRGTP